MLHTSIMKAKNIATKCYCEAIALGSSFYRFQSIWYRDTISSAMILSLSVHSTQSSLCVCFSSIVSKSVWNKNALRPLCLDVSDADAERAQHCSRAKWRWTVQTNERSKWKKSQFSIIFGKQWRITLHSSVSVLLYNEHTEKKTKEKISAFTWAALRIVD